MTENEYNHSVNIVADITDKAITFRENMLGVALETWGYCKEDVEKALLELEQYRKFGTIEEVREAVEKAEEKKPTFYATNWYCPKCGNLVGNSEFEWEKEFCGTCGQKIDWSGLRL